MIKLLSRMEGTERGHRGEFVGLFALNNRVTSEIWRLKAEMTEPNLN